MNTANRANRQWNFVETNLLAIGHSALEDSPATLGKLRLTLHQEQITHKRERASTAFS